MHDALPISRLEGARARAAAWCSIGVLPSNVWMDRSWGLQRDHRIDQAVRPRLDLADPVVLAGRRIAKDEARRLCAIGDDREAIEIGRAHVCTPVTNAQLVCRLLLEK